MDHTIGQYGTQTDCGGITDFYFDRYSPKLRADIGRYACINGVARTARYFSRKLKGNINESTVHSIKKAYVQQRQSEQDVLVLPPKKRGRPVLLGAELDSKVQIYLKKLREKGASVSTRIVIAAARGIVMAYDRDILEEFGGHLRLTRHWGQSILTRMDFVKRRVTTASSKSSVDRFAELKQLFLEDVHTTVVMEDIPPELIINWDQTGIKLVPSSNWTMEKRGAKRVEIVGVNDKRQITAVFCGSLMGDFLPIQLIYQGKTNRCHPRYVFPTDWHITHSPKHWSTEQTMLEYIENIIVPYVDATRNLLKDNKPALVIMDNFKGQVTSTVSELLDSHNIHVCLLPPNTTDRLQPMDISVNKPAKAFLKNEFELWYSEKVMTQLTGQDIETAEVEAINLGLPVLKQVSAKWLVDMGKYIAENPQFIVNGFIRSGITGALHNCFNDENGVPTDDSELEQSDIDLDDDDVIVID